MECARLQPRACACVQHVAHAVGGGVSAEACQHRFCHLQNTHALRGAFTPQESAALRAAVAAHGDRWSKVRLLPLDDVLPMMHEARTTCEWLTGEKKLHAPPVCAAEATRSAHMHAAWV